MMALNSPKPNNVWYHPSLSREEAERKLLQFDEDGTFLVRRSGSDATSFALSLLFQDAVSHYKIVRSIDNKFGIAVSKRSFREESHFKTIEELVFYYSEPNKGLVCPLLRPYTGWEAGARVSTPENSSSKSADYVDLESESQSRERSNSDEPTCDWILDRHEIVLSKTIIGEGAWGKVLKGTYGGCEVAVKEIHNLLISPYNRRLFEREMTVASKCRHPCLLQFIGATNDDQSPLLVSERMKGSLKALLHRRALKPKEIAALALDVACGLNYLHLKRPAPIVHRDISSANVLLWKKGAEWRAKISDYGAARFVRDSMTVCPGAPIYSAPEAQTSTQSPKIDVYSYGVLLCEMNIREQPDVQERENQVSRVTNHFYRSLIQRCLRDNPDERPSMAAIIEELQQPEK